MTGFAGPFQNGRIRISSYVWLPSRKSHASSHRRRLRGTPRPPGAPSGEPRSTRRPAVPGPAEPEISGLACHPQGGITDPSAGVALEVGGDVGNAGLGDDRG